MIKKMSTNQIIKMKYGLILGNLGVGLGSIASDKLLLYFDQTSGVLKTRNSLGIIQDIGSAPPIVGSSGTGVVVSATTPAPPALVGVRTLDPAVIDYTLTESDDLLILPGVISTTVHLPSVSVARVGRIYRVVALSAAANKKMYVAPFSGDLISGLATAYEIPKAWSCVSLFNAGPTVGWIILSTVG
jgi:hypothetical protein